MISRWWYSFHSSWKCTFLSAALRRHQPSVSYRKIIVLYPKYGMRATVSRYQKRAIGRPSKMLSSTEQSARYGSLITSGAGTAGRACSRARIASFDNVRFCSALAYTHGASALVASTLYGSTLEVISLSSRPKLSSASVIAEGGGPLAPSSVV